MTDGLAFRKVLSGGRVRASLGVLTLALFAAFASVAAATSAQTESRRSVWDGVYTDAQAARGERDYGRQCERCHNALLEGNPIEEIPPLVLDHFAEQWSERTVGDLFDRIKRSMPADNPDSLTMRAYVDIIAYILSANDFPSGTEELARDPGALQQIVIESRKK